MKQFINNPLDIVISGGGIAGLILALALGNGGKNILICEKGKYLNPNGADVLKPSGIEILNQLGLLPKLLEAQAQKRNEVAYFYNGEPVMNIDYRKQQEIGYFFLIPYQKVLSIVLEEVKKLSNVKIIMDSEITSIYKDSSGNIKYVVINDEYNTYSDIFIGADGINSKLRTLLGITSNIHYYSRAMYFNKFPMVDSVRKKNKLYVDDKNALAYFYPINNYEFRTVLSFEKEEAEFLFKKGNLGELKNRLKKFASFSKDAIEAISNNDFVSFPLCRMNLHNYHYHNAVFLGNAAHTVHPISGQGMNLAIEDAWELYQQISKYYNNKSTLLDSLSCYNKIRHPISDAIGDYADKLVNSFNSKDDFLKCLNPKLQTSGRNIEDLNIM